YRQMGIIPVKTCKLGSARSSAPTPGSLTPARSTTAEEEIFEDDYAEE
ncbi:unnamed protein product, partial [Allacma fusca]